MSLRIAIGALSTITVVLWAADSVAQNNEIKPSLETDFILTEKELARLSKDRSVVRVTRDRQGDAAALVFGAVDIDAPRSVVWNIMLDCNFAPNIVPGLKACEIVEHGVDGLWDIREHHVSFGAIFSDFVNIFRSDYIPNQEIQFHLVGGDLKTQEGVWRLESTGADQSMTRVYYRARLAIGKPVPRFLIRRTISKDMPRIFSALKETAEIAAGQTDVSRVQ